MEMIRTRRSLTYFEFETSAYEILRGAKAAASAQKQLNNGTGRRDSRPLCPRQLLVPHSRERRKPSAVLFGIKMKTGLAVRARPASGRE